MKFFGKISPYFVLSIYIDVSAQFVFIYICVSKITHL